ncbi:cyanovirin-N Homology domain-containing protein [Phanerochaete sordida]|uniref:Cyanovirin-N Homology domain-containing protein n=1 Tax=Phanerochaete sordida TaxID=48140 RepID=A0A9P3LFM2_9APHY|nr:cyanovirin-N Homology domain-containing protein [Phanerochaete sordida]
MQLTLSALSTALALTISLAGGVAAGYGDSCHDEYVVSGVLHGECFDRGGGRVQTQLDLNKCVGFANGQLACDGHGGFADSCDPKTCYLGGTSLFCRCGEGFISYLDLGRCIQNNDGQLGC